MAPNMVYCEECGNYVCYLRNYDVKYDCCEDCVVKKKAKEDDNMPMKTNQIKPQPIRNNRIKRDFARLLEIIADPRQPDYSEVEAIAERNGFVFDDKGNVVEAKHKGVRV